MCGARPAIQLIVGNPPADHLKTGFRAVKGHFGPADGSFRDVFVNRFRPFFFLRRSFLFQALWGLVICKCLLSRFPGGQFRNEKNIVACESSSSQQKQQLIYD